MRKFIERVTITGADDTIKPGQIIQLSKKYPFVEWGILLSRKQEGSSRFPSRKWKEMLYMLYLIEVGKGSNIKLSAHLCGSYVRDITNGLWTIFNKEKFHHIFNRFQLNFHAEEHKIDKYNFLAGFNDARLTGKQIIFQLDNINNTLLEVAESAEVNAVGLFDLSHGRGVVPTDWPSSFRYTGYAGGLGVDNVVENIEKIDKVAKSAIWIDFETKARNDKNEFDIKICTEFLDKCKPYIIGLEEEENANKDSETNNTNNSSTSNEKATS